MQNQSFSARSWPLYLHQLFLSALVDRGNLQSLSKIPDTNDRPVLAKILFEIVYFRKPALPDVPSASAGRKLLLVEQLRVDPYNQDFLIVGPVEDAYHEARRQRLRCRQR
jgi:hypothetical protein